MRIVDLRHARTHLSRLVEQASRGESFVIARAGVPLVKVVALDVPTDAHRRRLGFMEREFEVPDDFDRLGAARIAAGFHGGA